jgi:hypothetical protein
MPRYPSAMAGAKWADAESAFPAPDWTLGRNGRPAEYCRRDLVDGTRYLVRGIQLATGETVRRRTAQTYDQLALQEAQIAR